MACTLFNVLQGIVIVVFTQLVYDVYWGNVGLMLLAILAVALLSQLFFLNLVLEVKNYKSAERIGTAFGILSIMLALPWLGIHCFEAKKLHVVFCPE